jgi:hypothetical protein
MYACMVGDRAMVQADSRRPLTVDSGVRTRVNPCKIRGEQSSTGTGYSPSNSVFPCQYNSTVHNHLGDG